MASLMIGQSLRESGLFTNAECFLRQNGARLEMERDGALSLIIALFGMTDLERSLLRNGRIYARTIQEAGNVLTLFNFGKAPFIQEAIFDPTIYQDNRVSNILKSNMLLVVGIESSDLAVQAIRYASLPDKLYGILMIAWFKALENRSGYSDRYRRWVDDLYGRYSVKDLWDFATDAGYLGQAG